MLFADTDAYFTNRVASTRSVLSLFDIYDNDDLSKIKQKVNGHFQAVIRDE